VSVLELLFAGTHGKHSWQALIGGRRCGDCVTSVTVGVTVNFLSQKSAIPNLGRC